MRSATLVLLLSLLAVATLAQDGPQRGRVKKFDAEKGLITIATADGKEVEAAIVPQTQTRNAEGQVVAGSLSDAVQTRDLWTFRRDTGSRDPNWLLVETDEEE